MLSKKSILITGGTGSFGYGFVKRLISKKIFFKRLVVYSRDEFKQYQMKNELGINNHQKIRFFIGDVRDKDRLKMALEGINIVIHAAALKQVDTAEYNPFEYIKTNIIGAQNLIHSCFETGVEKLIALSTDKAVSPVNLYGATKLCSDKLFLAANNIKGKKKIKISIARYGNVMGSRGSILPFFLKMKNKGYFPITHEEMTRFNLSIFEAVDFVLKCIKNLRGGEIFLPKMSSFAIKDLAKVINPRNKIKIIGIRPGEKIDEEMITVNNNCNAFDLENQFVIAETKPAYNFYLKKYKKVKKNFLYNSRVNSEFMNINKLKKNIEEYKLGKD